MLNCLPVPTGYTYPSANVFFVVRLVCTEVWVVRVAKLRHLGNSGVGFRV